MINKTPLRAILFFLCSLLPVPCSLLHAQTADQIETLLQTRAVTYEQATNFVFLAAEIDQQNPFRYAQQEKWLAKNSMARDQINLKQVSLLIMQAFNIKGGPLYTITKNSHYAYREMVYQDIIQGRIDPGMTVSGEMLLFLVNRVLYRLDENPWDLPITPIAEMQEPYEDDYILNNFEE